MHDTMDALRTEAMGCTKCPLAATRSHVVFGVGNEAASVLFVGEGPGQMEDETGEPFVGRAGVLLDKMLIAVGFSRDTNIYIANMVKCRPPQNRDPATDEIQACLGYLRNQVRLIRPKFIVCLGRVAAQNMIDPDFRVTKQHGEIIDKNGTLMMGTFHPAALLRYPDNKPAAFDDLCRLRDLVAGQST